MKIKFKYDFIGKCDICGKPVTTAHARATWTDEDDTFHAAHSDCEENPHLKEERFGS